MTTIIREATINDLEVIQSLNKQLFEYERKFGETFNVDWTYSEKGEKYFQERLNGTGSIVLIAEIEGQNIGYMCGAIDTYSFRSLNPICELENMFVLENYRNRNVGSELITKFLNIAKEKGAQRIRVSAIYQNAEAINFYKKLGFADFELILERSV